MPSNRDNKENSTPRPEEIRRVNEAFLRRVLVSIDEAVKSREGRRTFGELTIKIAQQGGTITGVKVLEETILKPDDP